ncbi:MAG: hypothetical protein ACP5NX_04035 [Candidatus Bilamarchaeaceae archaeon]
MEMVLGLLILAANAGLQVPVAITSSFYVHIAAAMLVGLMMVALHYMIAYFLNSPNMFAYSKEELSAFILTIILVLGWGMSDGIMSSISGALMPSITSSSSGFGGGHVLLAYFALDSMRNHLFSMYGKMFSFEFLIGFLSTVTVPAPPIIPLISILSISFPPYPSLVLLSNAHTMLIEGVGYALMLIMMKMHILNFARYAIPFFILPLGLLMRAFPFTRMTGSSIIALCVVVYFVYPLSVLLSSYMIFDQYQFTDFVYTPTVVGICNDMATPDAIQEEIKQTNDELKGGGFDDVLSKNYKSGGGTGGTEESWFFAKLPSGMKRAGKIVGSGLGSIWTIFSMSFKLSLGVLVPNSSFAAGVFEFFIMEMVNTTQFLVLVTVTTIVEIIIVITGYRNVAFLIGGDVELIGMAKVV